MSEKTVILIITNKDDLTTDIIIKNLKERAVPFYRFNTEDLGSSIDVVLDFNNKRYLLIDHRLDREINLSLIKSVYFRRPEIKKIDNSLTVGENNFIYSELVYTLEGIYKVLENAYWINNVYKIRNAENKIYQLLLAEKLGFNLPSTIITNSADNVTNFYSNTLGCIIKPIKSGLVSGNEEEGVIFTNRFFLGDIKDLNRINTCPIYLQSEIIKHADIRVTIVNDNIFPVLIYSQSDIESVVDWRRGTSILKHEVISLPDYIEELCFKLTQSLGLTFSAIDLILDNKGYYYFLEINPNGQWGWIENHTKLPISDSIVDLLINESNK